MNIRRVVYEDDSSKNRENENAAGWELNFCMGNLLLSFITWELRACVQVVF